MQKDYNCSIFYYKSSNKISMLILFILFSLNIVGCTYNRGFKDGYMSAEKTEQGKRVYVNSYVYGFLRGWEHYNNILELTKRAIKEDEKNETNITDSDTRR
jgi:hypothetical protein